MSADWSQATDEEWDAECSRRWALMVEEVRDPIDEDDHAGESELDRLMAEDLRWCE